MSGHSKWSTIKRAKGANDAKRGLLFSKLARAITIAAKLGGPDVNANLKLRVAVDKARAANMPKDNVERAISKGAGAEAGALQEVTYEGYGPGGVAILVEAATDNKNRTTQEVKNLLEKNGGSMGTPGSVAFQFEHKGEIFVEKGPNSEEEMLTIMDLDGVEDVQEAEDGIDIYTKPNELIRVKEGVEAAGITVKSAELTYVAKTPLEVDESKLNSVIRLIELIEENDDVQKVYANLA